MNPNRDFAKLEKLVYKILREKPFTKYSNRKLMIEVWKTQGFIFPPELVSAWMECWKPESIRRCRQSLFSRFPFLIPRDTRVDMFGQAHEHSQYWKKRDRRESSLNNLLGKKE